MTGKTYLFCIIFFLLPLIYIFLNFGIEISLIRKHIQLQWLFLFVPLHGIIIALHGVAFQVLSITFQYRIKWYDSIGLSFIANLVNQLLPYRPGMAVRYLYLKKKYKMPLNIYMWVMMTYLLYMCTIAGFCVLIGWLFGALYLVSIYETFLILGSVFFIILTGLSIKYLTRKNNSKDNTKVYHPIINSISGLNHIGQKPKYLLYTGLIFFINYTIAGFIFYYIFISINHPISYVHCIFLTGLMTLTSIIPITSGNIGVNEGLMGAVTQIIYQDFSIGFSAMLIYRITLWIPSSILGCLFSGILLEKYLPLGRDTIKK